MENQPEHSSVQQRPIPDNPPQPMEEQEHVPGHTPSGEQGNRGEDETDANGRFDGSGLQVLQCHGVGPSGFEESANGNYTSDEIPTWVSNPTPPDPWMGASGGDKGSVNVPSGATVLDLCDSFDRLRISENLSQKFSAGYLEDGVEPLDDSKEIEDSRNVVCPACSFEWGANCQHTCYYSIYQDLLDDE